MTTSLSGWVVDGVAIRAQKLWNVMWDLTVTENATGGIAVDSRFHMFIATIMCADGRSRERLQKVGEGWKANRKVWESKAKRLGEQGNRVLLGFESCYTTVTE